VRIGYRAKQFWKALSSSPSIEQMATAKAILDPALLDLFLALQPSEQAHSLQITDTLIAQGEKDKHLLTAALLHDVGKTRYALKPWERVAIVLGHAIFPMKAKEWGDAQPSGWRRPFVVAAQHPAWGAEMAAQAGASPVTVEIIRRHQEKASMSTATGNSPIDAERLLYHLQILDDEN
jgi:putative nucleotidyltransferase with HDIG domain